MKLIIFIISLLLFSFSLGVNPVFAEVLFFDDFESGNTNQWTPVRGPNLWQFKDGRYGARIESGSTIIDSVAGNIQTQNYAIEFDIYPITGDDKNIDFRWRNNEQTYELHFNRNDGGQNFLGKTTPNQEGWPKSTTFGLNNNQIYHFKIVLQNQHVQILVDGNKIFDEQDTGYQFTVNEQVGLRIGTGASFPTEVWFDNVKVTSIDAAEPLNVPLLKQTSEPWQGLLYDTANIWSPLATSINRWGCALTSAAMVFQYHGINKLPDNTSLDPGTLNTWLNGQPDGYVGNGYINWVAVSRLSKLAKQSGFNPSFTHDALEYNRIESGDKAQLRADLQNNLPGILEVPGHFVVAKGVNEDTFDINDPFYNRSTLGDGYGNAFLKLGRYIPSDTDLSYILLVLPENINAVLKNSNGDTVGVEYLQQPIVDPLLGTQNNGPPIKILYFQKPDSGTYQLILSSPIGNLYNFKSYFYGIDGDVKINTINGILGNNTQDLVELHFNHDNVDDSSAQPQVTFESTLDDINAAKNAGLIKSSLVKPITNLLNHAQKDAEKGKNKQAEKKLDALRKLLDSLRGKRINELAYQILISDVNTLINSLKNP